MHSACTWHCQGSEQLKSARCAFKKYSIRMYPDVSGSGIRVSTVSGFLALRTCWAETPGSSRWSRCSRQRIRIRRLWCHGRVTRGSHWLALLTDMEHWWALVTEFRVNMIQVMMDLWYLWYLWHLLSNYIVTIFLICAMWQTKQTPRMEPVASDGSQSHILLAADFRACPESWKVNKAC